jgi:CRP-like cAMP-binding protein
MEEKCKKFFDVEVFLTTADKERTVSQYPRNKVVYHQGEEPADSVFYIQDGKVKVTVVSEQGKAAVVAILGKGDFFGETCLTGPPRRLATVAAMTECVIMRIGKAAFVRVLRDEPAFSERFITHLLARTARIKEALRNQLFNTSEKRLAIMLLLMANLGEEGTPDPVITKISQETLAEMVGTTRSRINVFMKKFRQLGFIEYDGGDLKVHSSQLSFLLHD